MGGLLRECGCFDGPYSAEVPRLVSIRCDEHADDPPLRDHLPMRVDEHGHAVFPVVVHHRRRMAPPRSRSAT